MMTLPNKQPAILTVNLGSSSVKWALFGASSLDASGTPCAIDYGQVSIQTGADIPFQLDGVLANCDVRVLIVRVVHGGPEFLAPVEINGENLQRLKSVISLAPLHNKVAINFIEQWRNTRISSRVFAVFDTEFFTNLPAVAQAYGLPSPLMKKYQIRRYGFHGFAHADMVRQWRQLNPSIKQYTLVTAQLGSGCSIAAIRDGKPVDTTMGFTPNEGLLMRTRSGDIDPGLLVWLQKQESWSPEEADYMLNHESGWRGMSAGIDNMADLFISSRPQSRLAFELFRYRFQKTLGAYFAISGGLDGVVLSGGIAENNAAICRNLLSGLSHLNIELEPDQADSDLPLYLSTAESSVKCYVVAADEAAAMLWAVQEKFSDDLAVQLGID
ncbi:hypothetical protein [Microbulbifer magnicolonia]|uniref:hypothetical protein n=1 Tax=Microbulbifer magnicolonia TaxID=3109744 RepID=UPI002B40B40F|nr:hypothetical protein [Microbulbifer sp. GG15]